MEKEKSILKLISGEEDLILKASDGSRLIYQATEIFTEVISPSFVDWGLTKKGVATPKTRIQVCEMLYDGDFMTIFKSLPGSWNQKWLSQNQVIDFCEQFPDWKKTCGFATMFLCKFDETEVVDEEEPEENLVVVLLSDNVGHWFANVNCLESDHIWTATLAHRVVAPLVL